MANSIRDYLLAGVAKQAGVAELEAKLNDARDGMYTCGVKAAIVAANKGAFVEACDKLMDDFRRNLRGIAEKYNMEQAKDTHGELRTDDDGNPVFKVPSSLSTVKSVLSSAFDKGIEFGSIQEPVSFGSIRTTLKALRDGETGDATNDPAKLTGDDKRRHEARELLASVSDALDGYTGKALTAIIKLIKALAGTAVIEDSDDDDSENVAQKKKAA